MNLHIYEYHKVKSRKVQNFRNVDYSNTSPHNDQPSNRLIGPDWDTGFVRYYQNSYLPVQYQHIVYLKLNIKFNEYAL